MYILYQDFLICIYMSQGRELHVYLTDTIRHVYKRIRMYRRYVRIWILFNDYRDRLNHSC